MNICRCCAAWHAGSPEMPQIPMRLFSWRCFRPGKKLDSFRGNAKLSSWIYRVTVNSCYDILRARQRETRKRQAYMVNPTVPEQDNSDIERLEAAIARLPELYREAIVLGVLSGMDGRSAAEQLGCSPNTLYQRIHKAKQLLRHKYREVQDE